MRNFAHISKDYFILKEYTDAQGRTQRFYDITFKGFILLVGGFTGKKALDCKLDYIDTFIWLIQEYHKKPVVPEIPLVNLTTTNGMPIEVFDYLVPKGMTFREGFFWLSTDMYDMILKFRDKVATRIERKRLKQQTRLEAKQKKLEAGTEVED